MKFLEKPIAQDFDHIKPGSLVLVKDPYLVFFKTNDDSTQNLYEKIKIENLALLVSITSKVVPSFWSPTKETEQFDICVLYNNIFYTTTIESKARLTEQIDFLNIPERLELDETDNWLNQYFGTEGKVFLVKTNFRARIGSSKDITNHTWGLPDRNSVFGTTFVKNNTKIVGIGLRRHAGRRMMLFDFFVNGVLCWIEIKTNAKKSNKPFDHYFMSLSERTPYETELLEQEKKRLGLEPAYFDDDF